MRLLSIAVVVISVALAAVIVWILGPGATWVLEHIDGATGLRGKDLAAALDAIRGRVLAVGTGLAALIAVFYTARNADTARRTFQLGERGQITDRYGEAAEQLGHAQAPVRLAGLYALAQLGENTVSLRQTIVDVICAYLRMPYSPPREQDRQEEVDPEQDVPSTSALVGSGNLGVAKDPQEEREVRLTAQRILADHLRYRAPEKRRWWQHSTPDDRHWCEIRLDLTGALLLDFDFRHCHVMSATFNKATFYGDARFGEATFAGDAWFNQATFYGDARFGEATFAHHVWFNQVTFTRIAQFDQVTITGDAWFEEAVFAANAWFKEATFSSHAWFANTTFTGDAQFDKAAFTKDVQFDGATFTGNASFNQAAFTRNAWFEATFTGNAHFELARGAEHIDLEEAHVARPSALHVWPPGWRGAEDQDGAAVLRREPSTQKMKDAGETNE
ncbi:pentapeptide repeat-containing protein [Nonomuraea sp. M3C6]|uniref:Pentapeptide repeat-containing protein n=1 Tax=Nonomuraea marmarensis TaxID=3351344 RepID=A0ABW7APF1_9ACTN